MKHLWCQLRVWLSLLCATAVLMMLACSDDFNGQASPAGNLEFALRGTSTNGVHYRLSQGVFTITGASTASVSAQDNLQAESINLELKAGAYSITLSPGWVLEVAAEDGTFSPVEAVLTSANPQQFAVEATKTTSVRFRFEVGSDVINLGNGTLTIGIEVDDSTTTTGGAGGTGGTSPAGSTAGTGGTTSGSSTAAPIAVAAGDAHTCALLSDSSIQCWGNNACGQLGNGSLTDSYTPVTVFGISNAIAVSAGVCYTCAVLSDGAVQCWGANNVGQLGNGTTTSSTVPVAVSGISTAIAVSAGQYHACALQSDGSVQCWGHNRYGQLGNGTTDTAVLPVALIGESSAIAVSAGGSHTCVQMGASSSGMVLCWGRNDEGQLGCETMMNGRDCIYPDVRFLNWPITVAAGGLHTCALLSNGSVPCWGANDSGQLGDGTTTGRGILAGVSGISNATAIAVGNQHSCAVLNDGSVQCWGRNDDGQVGNGTALVRSTLPVAVSGIADAVAVAAGAFHTCALRSDGAVRCWGNNSYGQLGSATALR